MKHLSKHILESMTPNTIFRVSFVGDIMQHEKQLEAEASRNFAYTDTFKSVKEQVFEYSDCVIGNLETTIGDDKNNGFPDFSAPVELLDALKKAGFDVLVTCNNHTFDKGELPVRQTHTRILERGMTPVGTCGSKRIHLSKDDVNITLHVATDIMNPSDFDLGYNGEKDDARTSDFCSYYSLKNIGRINRAHINIAYIHCGEEYNNQSTERQKVIQQELYNRGFVAVIFVHSHVCGEHISSGDNFVTYGLGNFISDQKNLERQQGQILTMTFDRDGIVGIEIVDTETIWKDGFSKIAVISHETIL